MSSGIVFKFALGSDIRRVTVQIKAFEELQQIIQQLFKGIGNYSIKYQDESQDLITITCALEFAEAFNLALKSKPYSLKFILLEDKVKFSEPQTQLADLTVQTTNSRIQTSNTALRNASVHSGVACHSCKMNPIIGVRYKCANCKSYDICANCESKGVHRWHVFIKLPQQILQSWRTVLLPNIYAGSKQNKRIGEVDTASILVKNSRHLASFVSDVTVPDGSEILANTKFIKIWKMRNDGLNAWPAGTKLIWIGGDKYGHSGDVPVPSVAPGDEFDISIELVAPSIKGFSYFAGKYVGYWRLATASGEPFGHLIWVDIVVTKQDIKL